jgi:hypothetical protein
MIIIVGFSSPFMELNRPVALVSSYSMNHRISRRLFSQSFDAWMGPTSPLLFGRNIVNYNPFDFYSPLADLCSMMMFQQRMNFFSSFHDRFSTSSFYRPTSFGTESFYRPTRVREEPQSSEAQLRRAYGVAENEDLYGGIVQRTNDQRHEQAIRNNTDGANYLKSVISDHIQALPQKEKAEFKTKIEESDPEVFIEIPRIAVKKAISSPAPLTVSNTPRFMHQHLDQLEQLRQKQKQLSSENLWKQCCDIATHLAREADCIAGMQKALETFEI